MPTVRAGNLETYYEERGQGPPVVLLHASLMSHESWRRQVEALAATHRVLALDLRGHGSTVDPSPAPYTIDGLADDVAAFVAALKLDRPVVVGWSLGGMVAMTYAAKYPDGLSALVLAGSPSPKLLSFAERMQRAVMPRVLVGVARLVGYRRFRRFLLWIQERVHGKDAMGTFTEKDLPDMATRDFARSVRSFATFHRTDLDLGRIRVPTLFIHGEKEPPFVAQHARLLAELAGARIVTIPGAGHAANLDRPEAFNEAVIAFLSARGETRPMPKP